MFTKTAIDNRPQAVLCLWMSHRVGNALLPLNTTPTHRTPHPLVLHTVFFPARWKTAPHVQAEPASALPAYFLFYSPFSCPLPFPLSSSPSILLPPSPLWLWACRPIYPPATWPGAHMDSWHSSRLAHKALCAVPCRQQQQYHNKH